MLSAAVLAAGGVVLMAVYGDVEESAPPKPDAGEEEERLRALERASRMGRKATVLAALRRHWDHGDPGIRKTIRRYVAQIEDREP